MAHAGGIVGTGRMDVVQDVQADAGNSSVANIAIGGTFTGTWKSTLGVSGIQATLVAGQPCLVYFDQTTDSGFTDVTDEFYYNPSKPFGLTVQAVGAKWRVRVQNIGAAIATGVRLNSVLCPVVESVPRALDPFGNLRIASYGQYDHFGDESRISPHGFQDVNQPYRLVGTMFGTVAEGIDGNFWATALLGGGGSPASASIATAGVVTLVTGTTNPSHSQIQTIRRARYTNLNAHRSYQRVRVPTVVVANSTRFWGPLTTTGSPLAPVDGYSFDVDSAGTLNLSCYVGGSRVGRTVASGSFNGDVNQYVVDTNSHAYEVVWTISKVRFIVDGTLLHTFNGTTAPLSGTQHLPSTFLSLGLGTSASMEIWSGSITRLGRDDTAPMLKLMQATAGLTIKNGPGRLHRLIVDTGNNSATIVVYDTIAAPGAGNMIVNTSLVANANPASLEVGGDFYTGLHFIITGASAYVTAVYE
jgi:hypothetical protein